MNGGTDAVAESRRVSAQAVCTAIRDDIVSGAFPPGSRLIEELLARRYGVSRVPVREALRTLASEGFVTTRRHAGACVAEPTEQEAADLLEVRALLEPLGAARAAQRRTEAHLKVLRGLVRLGRERARAGQPGELCPLGDWFDETLAQASGSPSLAALLTQVRRKIAWMYAPEPPARPVETWETHAALVDAVVRGDVERARGIAAGRAGRAPGEFRFWRPVAASSASRTSPAPSAAVRKRAVHTAGAGM
ncbi:GntR family transcriptional regulator [Streptomyces mobaraensis NBRC 13819 = DSM 40847]|uniref:GntR family transcriptional regulator n=1 Tax=Streptomyces mobaraensis (strain ATCC 29032 / DSM 40847 / JCM 4168 / NBRC 13819 / NCIMB 11159 / IPCR 16-22) TaxID=1223523 RepID=M3AY29_STRM1|nr:GntR family transcriptional regulator [Streptomyces mobaraensis]EME98532.1 GntR family transcriptional regulator [Streptomyces mobaraensis NBRC 13819 = DSM 40847]